MFLIAVAGLSFVSTDWTDKILLNTSWTLLGLYVSSTIYANWEKSTDPARYIIGKIVACFVKEVKAEAQREKERQNKLLEKLRRPWKKSKRLRSTANPLKDD